MTRYTIRCSSLPAAFVCPGSVRPASVPIDPVSDAADQGSAAHEVMRAIVEMDSKSIDDVDLVEIARKWRADPEQLQIQAFVGLKAWKKIREWFPSAQAEVALDQEFDLGDGVTLELTGHLDALSVDERALVGRLGDWKFGRVDKDHSHQVKGYLALLLAKYTQLAEAHGFVGWMVGLDPKEPDIEPYSMNRDQMWAWLDEVKRVVVDWDGVFHPGPQCAFCPRNHDCPAVTAMARRDVLALGDASMAEKVKTGLKDLPDRDIIAMYRRRSVLLQMFKAVEEETKARVEAAGDVLPDGDGRELRFVKSERRTLDPMLAVPVLEERLTVEEIAACTTIKASQVDDAIAAKTERGSKKAAIEELNDALRAAGAVSIETTKRLMDLRSKGA